MNVIFYNLNFSGRIALPKSLNVRPERYSHNMIGGPERAYLTADASADRWELMKLLRAPVEIYGDNGQLVWWGYVNRVVIPGGAQMVGLGLDELYNHVIVAYADGDTAAASDTTSITEYGQKETRLNNTNATQTEAEAGRNLYLQEHRYAHQEIELSGGRSEISIECYGWYSTLSWKHYTDADSTNTENTTQIKNIIASAGQFFAGSIVENTAGITSNENRDGHSTALTYVNQLLNAGTSNVRPLLARVDKDRYLHIYERQAEPPSNSPDYLLRSDGKLITPLGAVVPDQECKVAAWVRVKDVPDTLGGFSAMRPFFIESAEYNVKRKKTTYRAAGAFEQIRLSRWVADVISGTSSSGGSTYNPYSYLPYVPTVPAPRPRLHRYGSYGTITSGSGVYLTIASTPSSSGNLTYNGLGIFTPGTDDVGQPGWLITSSGIYDFLLWFNFSDGSPAPTTGQIRVRLVEKRPSSSLSGKTEYFFGIPAGGNVPAEVSFPWRDKLTAGRWLEVIVVNNTDSSISIASVELIATLERATG